MSTGSTCAATHTAARALMGATCLAAGLACGRAPDSTLPVRLDDEAFWRLSSELSDPPGVFAHSDNLVSNEDRFAHTVRLLRAVNGVYIGVGPEQNFSYIARLRPAMAFIVDIRRENRNLHLLYKALFEASADRREFVSRLFAREPPPGLGSGSSASDLFAAYENAPPSSLLSDATRRLVRVALLETHGWPIPPPDLASIDAILGAFAADGPAIHYARLRPQDPPDPSYRTLMTATDARGVGRSFLATDEAFAAVKDLHARNLIVPVIGDFGGPGALRRLGDYVRRQGGEVSAFYESNVEIYLSKAQTAEFCRSLAALPADPGAWFIDGKGPRRLTSKIGACPPEAHPSARR